MKVNDEEFAALVEKAHNSTLVVIGGGMNWRKLFIGYEERLAAAEAKTEKARKYMAIVAKARQNARRVFCRATERG